MGSIWPQLRELGLRIDAFHRQDAPLGGAQGARQPEDRRQRRQRACDHGRERPSGRIGLGTRLHHLDIARTELDHDLREESGLLGIAVEQHPLALRVYQGQDHPRQAGAAPEVQDPGAVEIGQYGKTIEEVARHHVHRIAHGGEIEGPVPFGEQREERDEGRASRLRERHPEGRKPGGETRLQNGGQAAERRLRCTRSSEMAAGVTPEIRAAWPKVTGRNEDSFCTTSVDRPRTEA